jgi:hypothetical protein
VGVGATVLMDAWTTFLRRGFGKMHEGQGVYAADFFGLRSDHPV